MEQPEPLQHTRPDEPRTDDCFEHIMRREIGNAFYGRANGDDAGYESYPDEPEPEDIEEDA